jgi:tetratricopeptide (TPR) repeat protein
VQEVQEKIEKLREAYLRDTSDEASLLALTATLIEARRITEALQYLQQSLQRNPNSQQILWHIAAAYLYANSLESALPPLYELLRLNPKHNEAREKVRFIHRKLVGSWHYEMMNDELRNRAFDDALKDADLEGKVVFEIGTGSGLLAMMAVRAGAEHVYTCEKSLPIAKAAEQIIARNGMSSKITLLHKRSTQVKVGSDIPERADLLIAEILGPALLEEQGLFFIQDAKERLLKKEAQTIPSSARMFAYLLSSEEIYQRVRVGERSGFDLSLFNALYDEPLLELQLSRFQQKCVSKELAFAEVNFANASVDLSSSVQFEAIEDADCHGIVQYFELHTSSECSLSTGAKSDNSHWRQVVQVFDRALWLSKGSSYKFRPEMREDRFIFLK